jgi:cysteine-rich repeat protein
MTVHARQLAPGFFLALLFGACFDGDFVQGLPCASDADCGPNLGCVEGLCGGPGESSVCGNALVEQGEDCDDGNTIDGDGCSSSCDRCGDGITQSSEDCDDGNTAEGDACTPACRFPSCGDGYQAPAEACDDGNQIGTDDCTPACELPACNDGFVNVASEVCDDGNQIETDDCTTQCSESPQTPTLELTLAQVKQFQFSWEPALGAESYQLLEDLGDGFEPVGADIVGESVSLTMPLHLWTGGSYKLRACKNANDCADSEILDVEGNLAEAIGHFKASNTGMQDRFGSSVAISRDGSTLAVGAPREDSSATGIDGDQADDSLPDSGAIHVFVYDGESWSQEAYIKASNPSQGAWFGWSVALSADGSTLGVSAPWAGPDLSGAAYVFAREDGVWSEQEQVGPANAVLGFGARLALSDDGDTMAVGAGMDASAATGIDGDPSDASAPYSGAVYVFARDQADAWSQEAYVKASNTGAEDHFGGRVDLNAIMVQHGGSVVLSADGNTMAVSAQHEDSGATGIDGDQNDEAAVDSGAVYVFERNAGIWSQRDYIKASNAAAGDVFGKSVALSSDGNTLVVGADGQAGGRGSAPNCGAVYVFERDEDESWSELALLMASNAAEDDRFGRFLALSGDGQTLAVSAPGEDSLATGIGGDQSDDAIMNYDAGAIYVFVRDGDDWPQTTYVKAPVPIGGDGRSTACALTQDGSTMAVGFPSQSSSATGIGGSQVNDDATGSGAVHVY